MYQLIDLFLHVDRHLDILFREYGLWTYFILFLIIFCETGLVIFPFLPGDSLLFAAGALAAGGALDVHILAVGIFVSAVVGDAVNYAIGAYIGPKVFQFQDSFFFKRKHLEKTQAFYAKYGGKTIVIARFVPIIRTFAPFLAGVATMRYRQFAIYNVFGAFLWVLLFLYGGYIFGELPFVKKNFSLVILMIIVISIMPAVIETIKARRELKTQ